MGISVHIEGMSQAEADQLLFEARVIKHAAGCQFRL